MTRGQVECSLNSRLRVPRHPRSGRVPLRIWDCDPSLHQPRGRSSSISKPPMGPSSERRWTATIGIRAGRAGARSCRGDSRLRCEPHLRPDAAVDV